MKIEEEQAGAGRCEAARGRPGRDRGAPWASGRPRRGAPRLAPTLCPYPAAGTAGDGGGHSCFHPAGDRRGRGRRRASPRWPGSQAAAVLARGRGAEPPPRSARRTSPFLPLGRLLCHNFAAATGRGHRPPPPRRSARRTWVPRRPEVGEGRPEPGPAAPDAAPAPTLAPSRRPPRPPRCCSSAHLH